MKNKSKKQAKRVVKQIRYTEWALPGFERFESRPVVDRLKDAVRPVMSQAAPGKYVPFRKGGSVPDYCLCYWHDNADGTWSPQPINQRLVRLDSNLVNLLGWRGQYSTLRRLGLAGFVEIIPVAPHGLFINLDSWFNHLRRCAEDPEFWASEKKNLKAYRQVIG